MNIWPFKRKARRRYYKVGDIAPAELLNGENRNMGAMISIDPDTNRITAIFVP